MQIEKAVTQCFKKFEGTRIQYWSDDALPTLLANLPESADEHYAQIDKLLTEGIRLYKQACKYEDSHSHERPKTYRAPKFPAPYRGLESKAVSTWHLSAQVDADYTAVLCALDLAVALHPLLWPAQSVHGTSFLIRDFNSDTRTLTVPQGMSQKSLDKVIDKEAERVKAVDPDNFDDELFFLLLRKAGLGVTEAQDEYEMADVLLGRVTL